VAQAFTAYNDIAHYSLGWIWNLAGKTDPWTLANIANQEGIDQIQAQGLDPNDPANQEALTQAQADALNNATAVSSSTPNPSIDCNNPSGDLLSGIYCSVKKFETIIVVILILLIAVYLGGKYFERRK